MKKFVVMFAGLKQSGKNTAAVAMAEVFQEKGFTTKEHAFADELRLHLSLLDPVVSTTSGMRWNTAIDAVGYDRARAAYPEMRRLMQVYGTEVIRDRVDKQFWASKLVSKIEADEAQVHLITDTRFKNEYGLMYNKFEVSPIWIRNTALETAAQKDPHASERPDLVFGCSMQIYNDGTLEEFLTACRDYASILVRDKFTAKRGKK